MDWNKELLPAKALEERRGTLMAIAKEQGIAAVIVYGDVYSSDELSYYMNYAPYWCNSAAVFTSDGDAYMVTGHNDRVNPWISELTGLPIEKLLASGFRVPQRLADSLKTKYPEGARIGLVGKYVLGAVEKKLTESGFEVIAMDDMVVPALNQADESYVKTVKKAMEIINGAVAEGISVMNTKDVSQKVVCAEIEYYARKNGAMDVILYTSEDGCAFSLPEAAEAGSGVWNVYVLMQYLGVWVSYGLTMGTDQRQAQDVREVLRKAAETIVPGKVIAAADGYKITVKSRMLSDTISSLNTVSEAVAENQVISIGALEESKGGYTERMFLVTKQGAVAL